MTVLLFLGSVAALMLGHGLRIRRWSRFIGIYEEPPTGALMRALSLGFALNFVLPFKLGDLCRAWYAGRRMKNGVGLSLATVVVDRFLDVLAVAVLFAALWATGVRRELVWDSARFYLLAAVGVLVLLGLVRVFSTQVKRAAMAFASVFNDRLRLKCERFFWSLINAFRELRHVRPALVLGETALMWLCYIVSYALLGLLLTRLGAAYDLVEIMLLLFSRSSLDLSALRAAWSGGSAAREQLILALYLLLPPVILFSAARLFRFRSGERAAPDDAHYLKILPQIDERDQLSFLDEYFSARQPDIVRSFIALNRDVSIIADCSSGSNAATILCMDARGMFYRKYAFGADGAKLAEQVRWLRAHEGDLPLCEILRDETAPDYCCYDMRYASEAVGMFQFVHSHPAAAGERVLLAVLDAMERGLYAKTDRPADPAALERYIETKVTANLERLQASRELHELMSCDTLLINHREYLGFPVLRALFEPAHLREVFAPDRCCEIHGDLTIENIICTGADGGFYLIDPNTGNVHDSKFLDYAKLLQSLHGGYEFMMKTSAVSVSKNSVDFICTRSSAYDALFGALRRCLDERFTPAEVRSIFHHELVHWLRLLPYKLRKDPGLAPMFYAGFIMVANDVYRWFEQA